MKKLLWICLLVSTIHSTMSCRSTYDLEKKQNMQPSNSQIIELLTDDSVKCWKQIKSLHSLKFIKQGMRMKFYDEKGNEVFGSQQDIMFAKVFNIDSMRINVYWKLPNSELYPDISYKIRRISKDTLVIGEYKDYIYINSNLCQEMK